MLNEKMDFAYDLRRCVQFTGSFRPDEDQTPYFFRNFRVFGSQLGRIEVHIVRNDANFPIGEIVARSDYSFGSLVPSRRSHKEVLVTLPGSPAETLVGGRLSQPFDRRSHRCRS